ncbi:MAG: hypothetical protein R3F43_02960 [bacterium]
MRHPYHRGRSAKAKREDEAYKLAADLGVAEPVLLDWLRTNGYPNARRGDTIRAEVAVAARRALGRGGQTGAFDRIPRRGRRARQSGARAAWWSAHSGVVRPPDRPTDVTEPPAARRARRRASGSTSPTCSRSTCPPGWARLAAAPTSNQAGPPSDPSRASARPSARLSGRTS